MSTPSPTAYEKLVKELLESRLQSEVPDADFEVFHDKKYVGKSGHNHQIDVAAEFRIAGVKIIVLVECKQYSKKVGIDDVMEFATRITDIGAHKGILVSTVGFQTGAIKIAQSNGIALVLACDLGWSPCLESPVAAMNRHEQFVANSRRFLSWFLDNPASETLETAVERISRCDVVSPLGVTPAKFDSLSSEGMGLQLSGGMFAPDHGFVVQGEGVDIVIGSGGLWQLVAIEQEGDAG